MKEVILITGAKGMIAKELAKKLKEMYTLRFLTRNKQNVNEFVWDVAANYIDDNSLVGVDHIIHLAGANIAGKRWSAKRKREIISSRVDSAKLILNSLIKNNLKIKTFISASAVGYYGSEITDTIFTEEDVPGNDFLSHVVSDWEKIAHEFKEKGRAKRVVITRNGVVLTNKGGALQKMAMPIKFRFGAVIGSGKQYLPWIHIEDLCKLYLYLLINEHLEGVYNAVAPSHITNRDFTYTLAKNLGKPIVLPRIPEFFIKILLGELSIVILGGSRISCEKLLSTGFKFRFNDVNLALTDVLEKE